MLWWNRPSTILRYLKAWKVFRSVRDRSKIVHSLIDQGEAIEAWGERRKAESSTPMPEDHRSAGG